MRGDVAQSELGNIADGSFTEAWDAVVARFVSFPAYVAMFQDATPSLLNVELTAPYGHAGQFYSLELMVRHYRDVTDSLNDYNLMDHVTDQALLGTQVANQADVVSNLGLLVASRIQFDTSDVVEFLTALTATRAQDLSDIVPSSVPSGLSVDM